MERALNVGRSYGQPLGPGAIIIRFVSVLSPMLQIPAKKGNVMVDDVPVVWEYPNVFL